MRRARVGLVTILAVIAEPGETLMSIAQRTLGNPLKWPILAAANHLTDPLEVLPGDIIVIGGREPLPFHPRQHAF